MLVIRMQRTGRKGHAMYRMVVQDSRRHPSSGSVVARLGSYDPHSKAVNIDVDKAQKYLDNGAQPTDRAVKILKEQKVKMPSWVKDVDASKQKSTRNPEKLRKNQPKEETTPESEDNSPSAESGNEKLPEETAAPEVGDDSAKAEELEQTNPDEEPKVETPAPEAETTDESADKSEA